MSIALIMVFLLGIANFALHRAVLESGHPLFGGLRRRPRSSLGKATMLVEFIVLFAALLLTAHGWAMIPWAYLIYSLANGFAAWLIMSDRV